MLIFLDRQHVGQISHINSIGAVADLANQIAWSMMTEISSLDSVRKIPATPEDWTKNAYYTIKGVGSPVAICSEPLFIDNAQHQELFNYEGMSLLAHAMAKGIDNWGRNGAR